ncbi:hypothetical protein SLEP1_g1083 [Rubroshorea leprosula]|uniref:Uncharacterized protein n=1 Tax=Rubroshorea leprosula TaxID=152421 RepID=A0AAV5HM52_9ROSI|nr:hypothetical protein SLEP1_g1083 [Rubroshorea leprosula]
MLRKRAQVGHFGVFSTWDWLGDSRIKIEGFRPICPFMVFCLKTGVDRKVHHPNSPPHSSRGWMSVLVRVVNIGCLIDTHIRCLMNGQADDVFVLKNAKTGEAPNGGT